MQYNIPEVLTKLLQPHYRVANMLADLGCHDRSIFDFRAGTLCHIEPKSTFGKATAWLVHLLV